MQLQALVLVAVCMLAYGMSVPVGGSKEECMAKCTDTKQVVCTREGVPTTLCLANCNNLVYTNGPCKSQEPLTKQHQVAAGQGQAHVSAPRTSLLRSDLPCVLNPAAHYQSHGVFPPECPTQDTAVASNPSIAWPTHSFVLSLPSKKHAFEERRTFLAKFGINLQKFDAVNGSAVFPASEYSETVDSQTKKTVRTWYDSERKVLTHQYANDGFLTLGERGYLASMTNLFKHASTIPGLRSVMVLDDDAVFHCKLDKQLNYVLEQPRCGSLLAENTSRPGVLLLGAGIMGTVKNQGPPYKGWSLTDVDLNNLREQFHGTPRCFNSHSTTYGSFAVVYHRETFPAILEWLKDTRKPFDCIYPWLSDRGFPVRVAYPFVAIEDVAHESSIANRSSIQSNLAVRAQLHRWPLHKYCAPDMSLMSDHLIV